MHDNSANKNLVYATMKLTVVYDDVMKLCLINEAYCLKSFNYYLNKLELSSLSSEVLTTFASHIVAKL